MYVSFGDFLRMRSTVPNAVKYEQIWTTETWVDAGFTPDSNAVNCAAEVRHDQSRCAPAEGDQNLTAL